MNNLVTNKKFSLFSFKDCVSNYNGVPNHFNTVGCARSINTVASDITLGFAVINSFMTVLAFITIPTLLGSPAGTV
jgi:hypothetical protein